MYDYISGTVCKLATDYATIENNGIGYHINCSTNSIAMLVPGDIGKLYIYMHVAEDEMSLYGFSSEAERDAFLLLISISKVGKRTALSILSALSVDDLRLAIITENAHALEEISGIGKKTAQRILLELKEKVSDIEINTESVSTHEPSTSHIRTEAIEALVAMGFDGMTASRAVTKVDDKAFSSVEGLIKLALIGINGD